MKSLSEEFFWAPANVRAWSLTFFMQVYINCLNNSSVDARPAAGTRAGTKVGAQETANVRVLVPLPLVRVPVSLSSPVGGGLRRGLQRVCRPAI